MVLVVTHKIYPPSFGCFRRKHDADVSRDICSKIYSIVSRYIYAHLVIAEQKNNHLNGEHGTPLIKKSMQYMPASHAWENVAPDTAYLNAICI